MVLDGATTAVLALFIQLSPMFNNIFIDIVNILYEAKVNDWGPQDICDILSSNSHGT